MSEGVDRLARLRALREDRMVDAVGGGRIDAEELCPSEVLAILDAPTVDGDGLLPHVDDQRDAYGGPTPGMQRGHPDSLRLDRRAAEQDEAVRQQRDASGFTRSEAWMFRLAVLLLIAGAGWMLLSTAGGALRWWSPQAAFRGVVAGAAAFAGSVLFAQVLVWRVRQRSAECCRDVALAAEQVEAARRQRRGRVWRWLRAGLLRR